MHEDVADANNSLRVRLVNCEKEIVQTIAHPRWNILVGNACSFSGYDACHRVYGAVAQAQCLFDHRPLRESQRDA